MRGFSFSLSFTPLRRLPCLLSAEKPQPCFCVCDAPHPGSPPVFLCTFPQPFFMKCSALPSPAPLSPKLAIPVKSLIKNAALSNQPASLLAAVHARLIRLPFPSLWPCRFRSALSFAIFLSNFFARQVFHTSRSPSCFLRCMLRPRFSGGWRCPAFGVFPFVLAFVPLFFCQNFASSLNNCGLHCRTPQKKAILSIINFKPFHFSRSETLWIPTIHPKKAAASG